MFAYNPGVADRSGEILGQGASQAALINQKMMSDFGDDMGSMMAQFANQYAENKALDAKGAAYADFMKRHGEQLGFDGAWIEDYMKKPKREQAMIGDNIIGMQNTGNRVMGLNYLNQQAAMYPRRGAGANTAAGGNSFTF